jgi:hypothetical protein
MHSHNFPLVFPHWKITAQKGGIPLSIRRYKAVEMENSAARNPNTE